MIKCTRYMCIWARFSCPAGQNTNTSGTQVKGHTVGHKTWLDLEDWGLDTPVICNVKNALLLTWNHVLTEKQSEKPISHTWFDI